MIDRRELLAVARERHLPLVIIEKDYVFGWVLWGLMRIDGMIFKGGTALAKVYFPRTWRLSEDLDFVTMPGRWGKIETEIPGALKETAERSGIWLKIKSRHSSPDYLQLKVQYAGPLGRNWLKVDVTPEAPIGKVLARPLSKSFSDYPEFSVKVESLEEVFSQKLRALVQRKKVRDYYDVWRMGQQDLDWSEVARLFTEKLKVKGVERKGFRDVFPPDLEEILTGYWEKELGRLVHPVPQMSLVLKKLKVALSWMEDVP